MTKGFPRCRYFSWAVMATLVIVGTSVMAVGHTEPYTPSTLGSSKQCLKAISYCHGAAIPERSIGFRLDQYPGMCGARFPPSSGEISSSSFIGMPRRSNWSQESRPAPPPFVTITRLSPLRGGCRASDMETSRNSCQVSSRMAPAISKILSKSASLVPMFTDAVWRMAALAPCFDPPTLMTTTGLSRTIFLQASMKASGESIPSM